MVIFTASINSVYWYMQYSRIEVNEPSVLKDNRKKSWNITSDMMEKQWLWLAVYRSIQVSHLKIS